MVSRKSTKPRVLDCSGLDDCIGAAQGTLRKKGAKDRVLPLLQKAERHAQLPADYIRIGETAIAAGEREFAESAYRQAEEVCYESPDFLALAHSVATALGERAKAQTLLKQAAEKARTTAELLPLAAFARDVLNEEALAHELFAQLEGRCQTMEDFRTLVAALRQNGGSEESARSLFQKASRYCGNTLATIAYADKILQLFNDEEWARRVLHEAQEDSQFTEDFLQLAAANQRLFNDSESARTLISRAEEAATTGDDRIRLAEAYLEVIGERHLAVAAFERAIAAVDTLDGLLRIGKDAAGRLEEVNLARRAYEKAEAKVANPAEAVSLARAVGATISDAAFISSLLGTAAMRFAEPADQIRLAEFAGDQVADTTLAERLYRNALERTGEFPGTLQLLESVLTTGKYRELADAALRKAWSQARSNSELLLLAKQLDPMRDAHCLAEILDRAEEQASGAAQLREVAETAMRYLPQEQERLWRLEEKVKLRERHPAEYAEFQRQEEKRVELPHYLELAEAVMRSIGDRYYAAKILDDAERLLAKSGFNIDRYRSLVHARRTLLGDLDGAARLVDSAAKRSHRFADLLAVVGLAVDELGEASGREMARRYLESFEQGLNNAPNPTAYDYTKLAETVLHDLNDRGWALRLLAAAEPKTSTPLAFAHIANLYLTAGETKTAQRLFERAARACESAAAAGQLVTRLRTYRLPEDTIRGIYATAYRAMPNRYERLHWAEGVVGLFNDRDWAREAYRTLAPEFPSDEDKRRFEGSRAFHLTPPLDS